MFKRAARLAAIGLTIAAVGCAGSDGSQGPQGAQGDPGNPGTPGKDVTLTAKPESCTVCHSGAGANHQAIYDAAKDASLLAATIDSVASVNSVTTVKLTITYKGAAAKAATVAAFPQRRMGAVSYNSGTKKFASTVASFASPTPFVADPDFPGVDGKFITTATTLAVAPETTNAVVFGYLGDVALNYEGSLFDNVANFSKTYGTVDYTSSANYSGCERCHGSPFYKEGVRGGGQAQTGLPDFVACKICHYDTRTGGHQDWQRLADDPWSVASAAITDAQKIKYAYKASVMNDVHMAHSMELGYPQSMSNCTVCHEGKLTQILADANFTLATCRSCHPVTGPADPKDRDGGRAPPLLTVIPDDTTHATARANLYPDAAAPVNCAGCHSAAGGVGAPLFGAIHNNGYDSTIYDSAGTKYASIFQVTVGDTVQNGTTVSLSFSATKTGGLAALDPTTVASITPTVLVGLYGYDTKDFIVDPHTSVSSVRNLEYAWGTTHKRFKNAAYANGTWTVDVDLSDWATMLNSTVTRFEVAVMPKVTDPAGNVLAVNAPSKTFVVGSGTLATVAKSPIVTADNCNKCHEALATTFHTPDRGGNVVVCRLCHNVRSGGAHLEMQSRNIDSYVHAIHEFQGFDIQAVDFTNKLKAMRFTKQQNDGYPNGGVVNCKSCHVPGTFENPPASDKSLPSIQSAAANIAVRGAWPLDSRGTPTYTFAQTVSNIGPIPSFVTGAASRACGGCHRAYPIKSNNAAMLAAFDEHVNTMGFLIPSAGATTLDQAIRDVMVFFR